MSRIATSQTQRSTNAGRSSSAVRQTLVIGFGGVVVLLAGALLLGGTDALAGAAIGVALVAVFLFSGRLPFLVDAQLGAGAAFLVLGINYLFRVVLLLVALVALGDQPWLDARVVGLVVIAGALAWNAMALRRHLLASRNSADPAIDAADELTAAEMNTDETLPDTHNGIRPAAGTVEGGR
jgi:hypothetical protein